MAVANETPKDWKIDNTPKPPPPLPNAPDRKAFVDAATGVLKAHGFARTNEPGDVVVDVPEYFNLKPGAWRWNGTAFVPYAKPPKTDEEKNGEVLGKLNADKFSESVIVWVGQRFGLTPKQAREELSAIYRGL